MKYLLNYDEIVVVGIRESRRYVEEHTLTVNDIMNSKKEECIIARGMANREACKS